MNNWSTEDAINLQSKQNTGGCFLDSGAFYGYKYEQNQWYGNLCNAPCVSLDFVFSEDTGEILEIGFVVNTQPYLAKRVYFDARFSAICRRALNRGGEFSEEFTKGLNGAGYKVSSYENGGNSYNGSVCYSQDYQYETYLVEKRGGESYFIHVLETHNGCDIRGGYSTPLCYTSDCEDVALLSDEVCLEFDAEAAFNVFAAKSVFRDDFVEAAILDNDFESLSIDRLTPENSKTLLFNEVTEMIKTERAAFVNKYQYCQDFEPYQFVAKRSDSIKAANEIYKKSGLSPEVFKKLAPLFFRALA